MKHLVKEQRAFNLRYTNAIPSPCFLKPNKNQADKLLDGCFQALMQQAGNEVR